MTKLEQVAESQAKFDGRSLAGLSRAERGRYMERARLAIEAMREPTAEMNQAVAANWGRRTWQEYDDVIGAALKEPTC